MDVNIGEVCFEKLQVFDEIGWKLQTYESSHKHVFHRDVDGRYGWIRKIAAAVINDYPRDGRAMRAGWSQLRAGWSKLERSLGVWSLIHDQYDI